MDQSSNAKPSINLLNATVFLVLIGQARARWLPELRVVQKKDVWYFRWISKLFDLWAPKSRKGEFLTSIWTTVRYTVGVAGNDSGYAWWRLAHEIVHALQAKRIWFPWFAFLYLWPMSQGGLIILTSWLPVFWASGWTLALWIACWITVGAAHFIPQIPGFWRAKYEKEAYEVSMVCRYLRFGDIDDAYIEHLVDVFAGMVYYRMDPRKDQIRAYFHHIKDKIEKNPLDPQVGNPLVVQKLLEFT